MALIGAGAVECAEEVWVTARPVRETGDPIAALWMQSMMCIAAACCCYCGKLRLMHEVRDARPPLAFIVYPKKERGEK